MAIEEPPTHVSIWDWKWREWITLFYKWVKDNMGRDFYTDVQMGLVNGHSLVHKFGSSDNIGTALTVVCTGEVYPTPTSAVSLEFVGDATDALNQAGMHEITIQGLDANWLHQEEVVAAHATNGATAVAIPGTWLRVYRAWVSKSGSYASLGVPSHIAKITVRVAGGGASWLAIPIVDTGFGAAQSLTGAYTIPKGKTGYLLSHHVWIDSGKTVDIIFFKRPCADDVSSSYAGAMRVVTQAVGIDSSDIHFDPVSPGGGMVGPCDVGFLAKGASTPTVAVDFELLLVDNK